MATTIKAGFEQLAKNLQVTAIQSSTMSTRQQNVRKALENGFKVLDSFLVGSYARSTMIAPLKDSDIDILMVLDSSYYTKYTPATLLDRVRTILLRTYPTTPRISRNGQAVTITFTDFSVDIVPAFKKTGGGFLIPDSIKGCWISTDPTVHATLLTQRNKAHNGNLIPAIKMLKGWNRVLNNAFSGFYLELMTVDILNKVTISDYPSAMRYIFDKGREKIKYKQADPAGFGDQMNGLSGIKTVKDAVKCFDTAYNQARSAEQVTNKSIFSFFCCVAPHIWRLLSILWLKL
jgi:predicted nucleotidyltransferase